VLIVIVGLALWDVTRVALCGLTVMGLGAIYVFVGVHRMVE